MGSSDDADKKAAKAEKKAAKAQAKLEKKLGKTGAEGGPQGAAASERAPAAGGAPVAEGAPVVGGTRAVDVAARAAEPSGPTPAERSAAAAERQVALHKYRMWISLIAALIALATLIATVRPWRYIDALILPQETPAATDNER